MEGKSEPLLGRDAHRTRHILNLANRAWQLLCCMLAAITRAATDLLKMETRVRPMRRVEKNPEEVSLRRDLVDVDIHSPQKLTHVLSIHV